MKRLNTRVHKGDCSPCTLVVEVPIVAIISIVTSKLT